MFEIGKSVVNFTCMGRTLVALVLSERSGEAEHLGSAGEPLLTLAFVDPARESANINKRPTGSFQPATPEPTVFIERDVVHASHEFSEGYKRDKGLATDAQIAAARGLGEWSEVVPPFLDHPAPDLRPLIVGRPEDDAKPKESKRWGKK